MQQSLWFIPKGLNRVHFDNNKKWKDGKSMTIKVRIFMDGRLVEPSELPNITISNPTVDRIVNDVVDRNNPTGEDSFQRVS